MDCESAEAVSGVVVITNGILDSREDLGVSAGSAPWHVCDSEFYLLVFPNPQFPGLGIDYNKGLSLLAVLLVSNVTLLYRVQHE